MLAAELLVTQGAQLAVASDSTPVPVAECRTLRELYRRATAVPEKLPAVFRVDHEPVPFILGYAVADDIAAAGTTGAAALVVCVLALCAWVFSWRASPAAPLRRQEQIITLLAALLITAGVTQLPLWERVAYDDFRRLDAGALAWPRLPLAFSAYALAACVALGGALGIWQRRGRPQWVAGVARLSAVTCLSLSVTATLLAFRAGTQAWDHDRRVAEMDVMTWEHHRYGSAEPLEVLRRWRP
jgi:hypothetical protein